MAQEARFSIKCGVIYAGSIRKVLIEAQNKEPELTWIEHKTGWLERTFIVDSTQYMSGVIGKFLKDNQYLL